MDNLARIGAQHGYTQDCFCFMVRENLFIVS